MINWLKTDIDTALRIFTKGNKVQCRIENSIWTFDLSQNNSTITLNSKMILDGEWYINFEK